MNSISVIIPTYQGRDRIETVLSSLGKLSVSEIIVVDDGSSDGTSEYINGKPDIKLVTQENKGRAEARNAGAAIARGDILWFLDDDLSLQVQSFDWVDSHFKNYPESLITGGLFEDPDQCITDFQKYRSFLSRKWQKPFGKGTGQINEVYLSAANLLILREKFEELNGFDADLRDAEDLDLAQRAVNAGYTLFYTTEIIAWHRPPDSAREYMNRLRSYKEYRELVGEKATKPRGVKRLVYHLFGNKAYLDKIDKGSFSWLPVKIRYKLYDIIFTAQLWKE